jgi:hypothetical protein
MEPLDSQRLHRKNIRVMRWTLITIAVISISIVFYTIAFINRAAIRDTFIPGAYGYFYSSGLRDAISKTQRVSDGVEMQRHSKAYGECVRLYARDIRISIYCGDIRFKSSSSLDKNSFYKILAPIENIYTQSAKQGWSLSGDDVDDFRLITDSKIDSRRFYAEKEINGFDCSIEVSVNKHNALYDVSIQSECSRFFDFIGNAGY